MSEARDDVHGFNIDVDDLYPCGFQVRHQSGALVPQPLVDHLGGLGHFVPGDDSATCCQVKSKLMVEIMNAFRTGRLHFDPVSGWGFEGQRKGLGQ